MSRSGAGCGCPARRYGTPTPGPRDAPPDLLDLAEELRDALADAAAKAARLVSAVRQSRKDQKVLGTILTNLKQLNLGAGGPR